MNGKITISRCSDDSVRVGITDDASGIDFVEATMTKEAFASALFGLGYVPVKIDVIGLEHVGKKRVYEKRTVVCPLEEWSDRDTLSKWLEDNCEEEGWILDTYLGSRGSVTRENGKTVLHYGVTKYV